MCIGRPKEAQGISLRHGAPIVARVVLGDNISEIAERIHRHITILTTEITLFIPNTAMKAFEGN